MKNLFVSIFFIFANQVDIPIELKYEGKINHFVKCLNNKSKPTVEDFFEIFSINSELEKLLYINYEVEMGTNESIADSTFDWVIMQNRVNYNSLVMKRLSFYFAPVEKFEVTKLVESKTAYNIYEIEVKLKNNTKNFNKYYIQISNLEEENYPIIDVFNEQMISIISNIPKGNCIVSP